MFHSSTTIWRQNDHSNPLSPMGNRPVFSKASEAITRFYSKVSGAKGEVFDTISALTAPIRGPLKVLLFPVTAPTQIAMWSLKNGYNWVAKPLIRAGMIASGTAWEIGGGIKDAIYNPAKTLVKAPIVNLKMSLLDFPISLLKGMVKLPGEMLRTPGRILSEIKKTILEFPGKVIGVAKTTRDNVAEVLENLGSLKPIEATKSIAKTTRDAIKGTLVDPVKDTLSHLWNPIAPLCALPAAPVGIVLGSKWQYATSMWKAAGEARNGVKRIIAAPGKELDTHGAKKWWNEVFPPKKEVEKPKVLEDEKPKDKPAKPKKEKVKKEKVEEIPKEAMEE